MVAPMYAWREDVLAATDIQTDVRNSVIDSAIAGVSASVDSLTSRTNLNPVRETRYFDWPSDNNEGTRVYFDDNPLVSVDTVVSGSVTIPSTDYNLLPYGSPPFYCIEIDLGSRSSFAVDRTWQKSLAITGVWGINNDQVSAGAVAAITSTTLTVTNGAAVGVGAQLTIGSEVMTVTDRSWVTSGQTQQADLTASAAARSLAVTDGSAFFPGERLILGAETMYVRDVVGNSLIVDRAQSGSVLAAHSGETVYVSRLLTVDRPSPVSHNPGDAITAWAPPALIRDLVVIESLSTIGVKSAGGSDWANTGEAKRAVAGGKQLSDLRESVAYRYGRRARFRVV